MDLLGRDVVNKEDQIRKLRLNIDEELVSFFEDDDQLIEEIGEDFRLKHLFDERMRQVQAELSALEVKFKEVEKRQTSNDMKRKMMQDDLRAKETQLREFEVSYIFMFINPNQSVMYSRFFRTVSRTARIRD